MLTEQLREIHRKVGELSSKVSEIEALWYIAFTALMHQTPRQITDAMINVQRTGEGQRQIIMAVASVLFPDETANRLGDRRATPETDGSLAISRAEGGS